MAEEISTTANKLIKLSEQLQTIKQKTSQFQQNYSDGTEYLTTYSTDYENKKLKGEIALDKVDESYKKITEIISIAKELKEEFEKRINDFIEKCEKEKDHLAKNNNEIINDINQLIELLVPNTELRKIQKRQNELMYKEQPNDEMEQLKNELENEKTKQLERFNLTLLEKNKLEEWTGRKVSEVIFNSKVHDWNRNTSVFDSYVYNRSHFILLIEDTNGNKFGCYHQAQLTQTAGYVHDSNAFVFSLSSNGRLDGMKKFPINNPNKPMRLYGRQGNWLLSVGSDGGQSGKDDINIMKQNCQHVAPGNGCIQQCYNYDGNENALCGSTSFTVKQFLVIATEQ